MGVFEWRCLGVQGGQLGIAVSPSLSIAPEREEYFRAQWTINLQCRHAGLLENVYPGEFCVGEMLSDCALLLVWIYLL